MRILDNLDYAIERAKHRVYAKIDIAAGVHYLEQIVDENLERIRLMALAKEFSNEFPETCSMIINEVSTYDIALLGSEIENRFPVDCARIEKRIQPIIDVLEEELAANTDPVPMDKSHYLRAEL